MPEHCTMKLYFGEKWNLGPQKFIFYTYLFGEKGELKFCKIAIVFKYVVISIFKIDQVSGYRISGERNKSDYYLLYSQKSLPLSKVWYTHHFLVYYNRKLQLLGIMTVSDFISIFATSIFVNGN